MKQNAQKNIIINLALFKALLSVNDVSIASEINDYFPELMIFPVDLLSQR